ncbi:MBL fold metallo-hydrolase [Hyphomicrobium sp.]|uniref:MBL fold metallo-hydrolase n=1 Tax=Hyphomicrobium sp. TaxID=82 RepID=UPI002E32A65B|nr:MBL fold metallo-hydrolase [Hyphomicrobium sp.]HEX2841265.1 MBL fold metallo-hydrolase [Hyphomicrobium sp.]
MFGNAMLPLRQIAILLIAIVAFELPASAASDAVGTRMVESVRKPAQLTVLFDAFGRNPALKKDWGYAALIEIAGRRILFDTGNDAEIFKHNVEALGIDLTTLDFVVLSHRHGDHTTGLSYLLSVNPNVQIYAPKENFGVFGSSLPSTFYRKDESLPQDMRYFGGAPPDVLKFGKAWPSAKLTLVEQTMQIAPGVHVISLVSDKPGTLEMRELSLAIETPEGVVVVVGCSHPGIERIVEAAKAIDQRIHLIAGGLHLVTTPDAEIDRQLEALRKTYGVAWIAAGHCTGEPAFAALLRRFGDHSLYAGAGATIGLGANPRADAGPTTRYALRDEDLLTYRTVMRNSFLRFGRPANHKR